MLKTTRKQLFVTVLALIFSMVTVVAPVLASALDDYIAAPDTSYTWKALQKTPLPGGVTLHQLSVTSQTWHNIKWVHRVSVVVPPAPKHKTVLLYITGSGSGSEELLFMGKLAAKLSAPMAVLFDIPNQPLFGNLREDNLISYTFSKYVESKDITWPLLLPMVKGTVRTMDAISELATRDLGFTVDGFVVFGGSKRGWTTWLSAAVDKRVKAIAPIAYDNLDLAKQMAHQEKSFGGFSEQISEYTDRGLQTMLKTELGQTLANVVDPYAYRERYTLPKLIIRGSNDPYWPVDAVQLYLNDLPGNTWIHYDPNGGHGLANLERVLATVSGFYLHAVGALPLAPIRWNMQESNSGVTLEVQAPTPAASLTLWSASSTTTDFRKSVWTSLPGQSGQKRSFDIARPTAGYKAVYGEVVFQVGDTSIVLDTPVYVVGSDK